jgi:hypothetical protein
MGGTKLQALRHREEGVSVRFMASFFARRIPVTLGEG